MSVTTLRVMQGMMKGATDIKVTVTPTDETKKIGDWKCRKYIQEMKTMMGPTTSEIWATQDLKIKYDVYQKFKEAFGGQGTFGNMMSSMAEEMKKVEGVPVLTTTTMSMMGANITSTTELLEFKEVSAPEGTFDIPSGYKKTENHPSL